MGKDTQKANGGHRGGPLSRTKQTFALILIVRETSEGMVDLIYNKRVPYLLGQRITNQEVGLEAQRPTSSACTLILTHRRPSPVLAHLAIL